MIYFFKWRMKIFYTCQNIVLSTCNMCKSFWKSLQYEKVRCILIKKWSYFCKGYLSFHRVKKGGYRFTRIRKKTSIVTSLLRYSQNPILHWEGRWCPCAISNFFLVKKKLSPFCFRNIQKYKGSSLKIHSYMRLQKMSIF